MGLRHLHALITAGYQVDVYDPSPSAIEKANQHLSDFNCNQKINVILL